MKLLPLVQRQRLEFRRRDIQPNRLLCPLELKYELLGECFEAWPGSEGGIDNLHIMGLKVLFSEQAARLEVAAVLE